MVIESLRLRNYRRFRALELEFPENLIGIIGPNGVGKTTIVEALGWALYGNRIVRTDKSDVRSQSADSREACAAELVFWCAGQQYRVVRQLKGKNAIAEAAIYRQGAEAPAAVQDSGVTEFVEKLLGLDYQSFFASVFARQKELDAFSRLPTAERLKCINRLINIDLIDRAREQARSDRNQRRAYSDGLRKGLKDERLLRDQLAQLEERLEDKQAAERQSKESLLAAREAVTQAKKQFEALSTARERFLKLATHRQSLERSLSEWQNSLADAQHALADIDKDEVSLRQMEPQLRELSAVRAEKERLDKAASAFATQHAKKQELGRVRQQLQDLQASLTELHARAGALADLEAQLAEVDASIDTLEKELDQGEKSLKDLRDERAATRARGQELRQKHDQVQRLGPSGPCPVCTRPLGEHHAPVLHNLAKQLAELRETYRHLEEKERIATAEQERRKEELRRLRSRHAELLPQKHSALEAARQLAQTRQLLARYEEAAQTLEQEIAAIGDIDYDHEHHEAVQKRFDELTQVHNQALVLQGTVAQRPRLEGEITRLRSSIEAATAELAELEKEMAAIGFDEQEYQRAQQLVEECSQALDQRQQEHSRVREDLVAMAKEKERVLLELEEHQRQSQEIAAAEQEVRYLELLDYHFDQFRQELANRLRPLIATRASELLRLTTQGRYSLLELDHEYNVRLYDGTVPYPLARFSGGEQDLTNLCLRIAISQVVAERSGVTPMNFIVLDEVFGSQDEHRRQLILSALNQLSARFRQIFVITHIEPVRDSLPVVISVEELGEHESTARFV